MKSTSPEQELKPKKDKYSRARGGTSKFLDLYCAQCLSWVALYQKDGPGILKRCYVDRIFSSAAPIFVGAKKTEPVSPFICSNCQAILGTLYSYEKENRPAYLLKRGSLKKKVVKRPSIIKK